MRAAPNTHWAAGPLDPELVLVLFGTDLVVVLVREKEDSAAKWLRLSTATSISRMLGAGCPFPSWEVVDVPWPSQQLVS